MTTQSESHFAQAKTVIPGGVNSPVRAFKGVGGTPLFFKRGKGAFVFDEDDNAYIDYVGSWGPLILGHAHPEVIHAVQETAKNGLGFGAPTARETTLAKMICNAVPSIEKVRLVNSGTEATMSALRLARAFTGRNKIIKFTGCYHGHCDSLLVKAGSGLLTLGIPNTPGVPEDLVKHTLCATFNDLDSVTACFEQYADDIACIIVEPVAGNMNCIPGTKTFLQGLRDICDQYKSVLIFDEVMTGFRVAHGGAQSLYNITPDLTTLGKVIGGGLPVGAFGGKKDIMSMMAPEGPVYQAGTLSGNPLAVASGIATLKALEQPGFYESLSEKTKLLAEGLKRSATSHNIPLTVNYIGGMFGFFFTDKENVTSYDDALACNVDQFKKFFHAMLKEGVYFAPSAFEAGFVSSEHSYEIIGSTITCVDRILTVW